MGVKESTIMMLMEDYHDALDAAWGHELKNLMLLAGGAIMMHFFGEPHNSDQANYH